MLKKHKICANNMQACPLVQGRFIPILRGLFDQRILDMGKGKNTPTAI